MKIEVLGSSGGGSLGYNLSSFLIDETILLDAGSVINVLPVERQLKISGVFITHAHFDHIRDLPLLVDNFLGESKRSLEVYALKEVIFSLKDFIFNNKIWPDFTKIPNSKESILKFFPLKLNVTLKFQEYKVKAIPTKHTVPSCGFIIEKNGKRLFYSGDTGPDLELWNALKGIKFDVLITELSFPDKMEDIALASKHYTPRLLFKHIFTLEPLPDMIFIFHLKPIFRNLIIEEVEYYKRKYHVKNLSVLSDSEVIEF